ncbi:MAG: ABC transporter permease [Lachnospiraceae bacterium]|jgi:simple sugar transport system permease protein|nr:ABC transporter permease [Lachnospiraceae bacterium]MCI8994369.1 ABC transporter permease [Lachnospiraceae bacterium]MCI9132944.1 ABC transporter permease [Lachnospiraceae bacterium]
MAAKIKNYFQNNVYTSMLLILLVALLLFFTVTKGGTLWSLGTWNGIFMQFPEYGLMTLGVMFCFISGNIDMSFVALGNFACIVGVNFMASQVTEGMGNGQITMIMLAAILIVMVIGAIGGVVNGLLISLLNIPPVMATIAMQLVWTGVSVAITEGKAVSGLPTLYTEIGHKMIFGFLPFPFLVFLIVFAISAFLLKCTTYGEKLYMIGTNIKAAKFSAINTTGMTIGTFVLCDVICCIGSLLMVSTMASTKADYGTSYVMRCILILVLAGVLPDGGMGKISNVFLAIISIQIIASGVNMFSSLNTYYASLIWGGLLIIVLILSTQLNGDGFLAKKRRKSSS